MNQINYTIKQDPMGVDYVEGIIGETVLIIPIDANNSDYQAYLESLNEAKTK